MRATPHRSKALNFINGAVTGAIASNAIITIGYLCARSLGLV